MFKHLLTVTFRNLARNKMLTSIHLIGLSVSLICVLAILMWVKDEMSYDQFHGYKDRLYKVLENHTFSDGTIGTQSATPGILAQTIREEIPEAVYTSAMDTWTNTVVTYDNRSIKEEGRYVGEDFLKMFSFPLLEGNHETALSQPGSIVISKRLADKLFPGAEPMGKVVKVSNWTDFKVTGVMDNLPSNTVFDFEFLMPFNEFLERNPWAQSWNNNGLDTWIMLDENADVASVNAKIKDIVRNHGEQKNVDLFLQPLTDVYLRSDFRDGVYQGGGRIQYVRLFGLIAILVLIMACVNFMNLSTARAAIRAKEVGVRKVVGAARALLTAQYVGEAVLFCILSSLIAVASLKALMPAFNLLTDKEIVFSLQDPGMWLSLAAIVCVASMLAGIYPALMISGFKPVHVLKGRFDSTSKGAVLRKGLVIMQFTIATFLIMAVLIVHMQLKYMQEKSLGYQKEQLVFVNMTHEIQSKLDLVKQELAALPGIQSISASHSRLTGYSNATDNFVWEGKAPEDNRMFVYETVTYDYLETIGATLIEGRDFSKAFRADSANYVINESAAKAMGFSPPYTGRRMKAWGNDGEIIGVVKDFHFTTLKDPLKPLVLLMNNPYVWTMYLRIDGHRMPETLRSIEDVYKKHSPVFPFEYVFADAAYNDLYTSEHVVRRLSSVFAFLAVLISCLGLFALAMFTAQRKVKEIGIRKVLGASVTGVVTLLSKDFLIPVCVALVLALPASAWFLSGWLESFAYRIKIYWWLFVFTGLIAISIAFLTISYQSIKAAMMNPVESLRSE